MTPEPLTRAQRRHLTEMLDKPFWYPTGSAEHRCARNLYVKGFLAVRHGAGRAVYEITPAGEKVARDS